MMEMLWVILIVVLLAVVSASTIVPWIELIDVGRRLMLAGVAIGIPLEMVYFLLLRSALTVDGTRPDRWYWRPFSHHHRLDTGRKVLVLPFYCAGALAFLVAILGALLVAAGVVGAFRE